jgi:hypothetical protein
MQRARCTAALKWPNWCDWDFRSKIRIARRSSESAASNSISRSMRAPLPTTGIGSGFGATRLQPGARSRLLGSDPETPFSGVDAKLLYDAWESTSEIIPQLNRSVWAATDGDFAAEGAMQRDGFLTVNDYYFARDPMPLTRIDRVQDRNAMRKRGNAANLGLAHASGYDSWSLMIKVNSRFQH